VIANSRYRYGCCLLLSPPTLSVLVTLVLMEQFVNSLTLPPAHPVTCDIPNTNPAFHRAERGRIDLQASELFEVHRGLWEFRI
jgi:hypothetical protein